ncbi:ABC transporter ATP-binding protein [Basilea psittacipulmonis]|uniref:Iron ABC transporter ATP-binding protein n=1 Tax=Basilea psittacipulmonis DSM 24701 TaxID=1072685 RepID=A0A077DCZ2_9BURK|nr:ATP-binding cassette domain-containing protein [Basilea psittacipulmonis]AIL32479.1 iron ABC transporter ATP-binding protein [Basilea psittacipulmonis DSM 24701]
MVRQTMIAVKDLCNSFGPQIVHEHLDFTVYSDEIVGIVGGSGTGKSVLLRTILGLNQPTSGQINLFGQDILTMSQTERMRMSKRIGVLFQQGALYSSLNVLDNVSFPLIEQQGLSRSEAHEIARMKIALVGLPPLAADKYPLELSGGMIKRAALARALALDPEILFLDEPTAGLDPIAASSFDQLVLTLKKALKLTIVMVTHDLDSLYTICDRVAVLYDKKVLANEPLSVIEQIDNAWIQAYFHGPRGRAAYFAIGENNGT